MTAALFWGRQPCRRMAASTPCWPPSEFGPPCTHRPHRVALDLTPHYAFALCHCAQLGGAELGADGLKVCCRHGGRLLPLLLPPPAAAAAAAGASGPCGGGPCLPPRCSCRGTAGRPLVRRCRAGDWQHALTIGRRHAPQAAARNCMASLQVGEGCQTPPGDVATCGRPVWRPLGAGAPWQPRPVQIPSRFGTLSPDRAAAAQQLPPPPQKRLHVECSAGPAAAVSCRLVSAHSRCNGGLVVLWRGRRNEPRGGRRWPSKARSTLNAKTTNLPSIWAMRP